MMKMGCNTTEAATTFYQYACFLVVVFGNAFCSRYGSKVYFWDSLGCFTLVCNKEQLYVLIDTEAEILIYSFFYMINTSKKW